jgi:alpha-aminoadipic semialdehyde synthase
LINRVLDILDNDAAGVTYTIAKVVVRPNTSSGAVPSNVTLALHGKIDDLKKAEEKLRKRVESHPNAAGSLTTQGKVESKLRVTSMKNVVLFGAGRVAGPVLKLLSAHDNVHITVASDNEEQANELRSCIDSSKSSFIKFKVPEDLSKLPLIMKDANLAISLLPATLHLPIAEEAVAQQKHLVTSSYVSPGMAALSAKAAAAGVILMNEAGLDPGIDHMLIMKAIDHIHRQGGKVEELVSLCGGLPDPVAADNPLRYKFSWSPRGVLSAAGNEATYLSRGEVIRVPGDKLLLAAVPSPRFPTMRLEALPNRNSLLYKELYNIPEAHSVCRGTLRYEGN